MRLCPSCDRYVFDGTCTCPFCKAPCGTVRGGSLAILGITLGVALTACGEPKPGGDENTTASTPSGADWNTTVDTDDPEDSFDAYGATYTVSGDSPWSTGQTNASTYDDPHTATGTDTDTDTDTDTSADTSSTGTGTDTDTSTTTGTDTGTSTTTTTDTGSTDAASSTG